MRRARVFVLALLALLLAPVPIVVNATPAHACTCADVSSDEIWDGADTVVRGTITDRRGEPDGFEDLTYEVQVSAVYKGDAQERLTFSADATSTACGWTAEIDDELLLVLHRYEGELITDICTMSQSTPIPDAYVGTEQPPAAGGEGLPAEPTWTPLWLGLGLGAAVLAGLWLVLRRPLR